MPKKGQIKSRLGEKFITNQGYEMEIIEYFGTCNCTIKFNDNRGTIRKNVAYKEFKSGSVNNYFHPTVCGVGYLGFKDGNQKENKHYMTIWRSMLNRAYNSTFHVKQPTYKDIVVWNEWKSYVNFSKWVEENYNPETMLYWNLDKDILVKGNKIYSPETCCFVPQEINNLFVNKKANRGKYPIGVSKKGTKFKSELNINRKKFCIGLFDTPEEAFQAYKFEKEKEIKRVADKWRNQIDPRVYEAMYNYQVEITD